MPEEQIDANTDTASSAESTGTDVAATAAEESSTSGDAKQDSQELSLADVVKNAAEESAKSSVAETEKKEGEAGETETEKKEDVSEETKSDEQETKSETDDEQPPFHEHPRWKEVQQQLKDRSAELEAAKPHLERVRALDSFCQENKISSEDLKEALTITALLRQNPQEALNKLKSYTEQVETALGQRLPNDLQKKVDDGLIDVDTAKELTALRLQKQGAENSTQRQQMEAAQKTSIEMAQAINSWEQTKVKSDPDWGKKYPLIFSRYKALVIDKQPKSAADALALAEEAYKTVSEELVAFLPKPTQRRVLGSNGSSIKAKPALALDDMKDLGQLVRSVAAGRR